MNGKCMQILIYNTSTNPELPVIIWSKTRILKWTDFKKKSDPKDKASASAAIGFESKPIIEHIKIGNKFKFKIRDMQFHAVFIPDLSWVMKNLSEKNSKLLLKHEQGHFDLGEEITRKAIIKTTNRFQNRSLIVKGKNEYNAKKDAIFQVTKIRKEIEDELQKEFKRQEAKYDDKTNHGLIIELQEKYNKRFEKLRLGNDSLKIKQTIPTSNSSEDAIMKNPVSLKARTRIN
jgi:hypothetical protein